MTFNIFDILVEFEEFFLIEGRIDGNKQPLGFLSTKNEIKDKIGDICINISIRILKSLHWFLICFLLVLIFLERDLTLVSTRCLFGLSLWAKLLLRSIRIKEIRRIE